MPTLDKTPDAVSGAGLGHNYTNRGNISVVFVQAPLDAEYRNVGLNQGVVDAYIQGRINAGAAFQTTVKGFNPDVAMQITMTMVNARMFNYMRVTLPNGLKWYSFVIPEYLNDTTVKFVPRPDYWTIYQPGIGLGFVRQSHVAVAASQNDAFGDQYLTEPEDIAVGELRALAVDTHNMFSGGYNIAVVSTTALDTASGFRNPPFADEPYERLNLGDINSQLGQHGEDIPNIYTYVAGTISGSTQWPWPNTDASYANGYALSGSDIDPQNWPWVDGTQVKIPRVFGARPSTINNVPASGGVYVYASMASYLRHMSILAHVPWISQGIQTAYIIPAGLYGTPGADTSEGPVAINPTTYQFVEAWTAEGASYASYKQNITYSRSQDVNLRSGWRGLYNAGIYRKLFTSQFSSVELSDRNGSVYSIAPENLRSNDAVIRFERTAMEMGEATAYLPAVGGSSEEPMHIGWSVTMPRFEVGRDASLSVGAASQMARRGMRRWKFITEARNLAYARYGSQAQDGFNTVINRFFGGLMGGRT